MIRRYSAIVKATLDAKRLRLEAARDERAALERRIDARLSAARPWSDRWWYEVGCLNTVRRERIRLDSPIPLG
jgi:hypothetical protein